MELNTQLILAWNFPCLFIYCFSVFYFDACLSGAKFTVKLVQIPLINKYEKHREITGYFCKLFQNRIYRSLDFLTYSLSGRYRYKWAFLAVS